MTSYYPNVKSACDVVAAILDELIKGLSLVCLLLSSNMAAMSFSWYFSMSFAFIDHSYFLQDVCLCLERAIDTIRDHMGPLVPEIAQLIIDFFSMLPQSCLLDTATMVSIIFFPLFLFSLLFPSFLPFFQLFPSILFIFSLLVCTEVKNHTWLLLL